MNLNSVPVKSIFDSKSLAAGVVNFESLKSSIIVRGSNLTLLAYTISPVAVYHCELVSVSRLMNFPCVPSEPIALVKRVVSTIALTY